MLGKSAEGSYLVSLEGRPESSVAPCSRFGPFKYLGAGTVKGIRDGTSSLVNVVGTSGLLSVYREVGTEGDEAPLAY